MALNAQGVQIRRASSNAVASVTYSSTSGAYMSKGTTCWIGCVSDTADYVAAGITTANVRIKINTTNTKAIDENKNLYYTPKEVGTTSIQIYEQISTAWSSTAASLSVYAMDNIGDITGWNGPNETVAIVDVTHLQSTAKEKMSVGVKDSGQVSIDFIWDVNATFEPMLIRKDIEGKTKRLYDITFNDSNTMPSYCAFEAIPTAWSIQGALDDVIKGTLTLDISGYVQYTTKR